jgi:phage tail sheath protein FI
MPPSGHVAGRYAFNDLNANVGKAPAGVNRGQITGFFSGVERSLSDKGDRDIVYQAQINPIRSDSEVGNAIWGNKTLQIVGDFTDVNIRRLFIYLRKTQEAGLLDIVFEDVGPVTFGIIKQRLDTFLEGLFLNNVIGSGVADKSQAFKVICDLTNNPEPIQDAKMIIADEYIKPNLAAEVILLRIQRIFDASQIS